MMFYVAKVEEAFPTYSFLEKIYIKQILSFCTFIMKKCKVQMQTIMHDALWLH